MAAIFSQDIASAYKPELKIYWPMVRFSQATLPLNEVCQIDENTLRTLKPISFCSNSLHRYECSSGGSEFWDTCRKLQPHEIVQGYELEREECDFPLPSRHLQVSRHFRFQVCITSRYIATGGEGEGYDDCIAEKTISESYPLRLQMTRYQYFKGKDGLDSTVPYEQFEFSVPTCKEE